MIEVKQWKNFPSVRAAKELIEGYERQGALTRWWTERNEETDKIEIFVEVATDEGCLAQGKVT